MSILAIDVALFCDLPTSSLAVAGAGKKAEPRTATLSSSGTRASVQGWVDDFRSLCTGIRALESGWAGPGSRPVVERNFYLVEQYLALALARVPDPQLPSVVPSADGGLQIEWNREAIELEVLFGPDGKVTALVEDHELGVEIEEEGNAAVDLLLRWAPRAAASRVHDVHDAHQVAEADFVLAA